METHEITEVVEGGEIFAFFTGEIRESSVAQRITTEKEVKEGK